MSEWCEFNLGSLTYVYSEPLVIDYEMQVPFHAVLEALCLYLQSTFIACYWHRGRKESGDFTNSVSIFDTYFEIPL